MAHEKLLYFSTEPTVPIEKTMLYAFSINSRLSSLEADSPLSHYLGGIPLRIGHYSLYYFLRLAYKI